MELILTQRQQFLVKKAKKLFPKNHAIFWPVGTGKSIAALSIARVWGGHILILARANNLQTWVEEARKAGVYLSPLRGGKACETPPFGNIVMSHDLAGIHWKKLQACKFTTLIVDESYQIKNIRSRRSKGVFALRQRISHCVILNALPFSDQGYVDIYGQYHILDKGSTFGTSLTRFREYYQYPHPAGYGWIDDPTKFKILTRKVASTADFMMPDECDLPLTVNKTFYVEWNETQKEIYDCLKSKWEASFKEEQIYVNHTVSKLVKLHQIGGGIFRSAHRTIQLPTNKLARLLEILEQLQSRAVVWCAYNPELELVSAYLRQRSIPVEIYCGGSDVGVLSKNWKVLVAQIRCGVGINDLTNVPYSVYYSKYWSYYFDYQSRGRTARLGSKHKHAFYFSLVIKGSVDELVESTLEKKITNAREFATLGKEMMK